MYGRLQRRFNQSVHTDPYRLFILLSHVCFRQLELARATVAQNAETTLPAWEQVLTPPPHLHPSTRHPPSPPQDLSRMWIVHVWCSASVCINDLRLHNCRWYIWQPSRKFKAGANSKAVDGAFFFFSCIPRIPRSTFERAAVAWDLHAWTQVLLSCNHLSEARAPFCTSAAESRCRHEW